jgi:hypothetical protein
VYFITKIFKVGNAQSCYSNPSLNPGTGQCEYSAYNCIGANNCSDSGPHKRPPVNGTCPPTVAKKYRWFGFFYPGGGGGSIKTWCSGTTYTALFGACSGQ